MSIHTKTKAPQSRPERTSVPPLQLDPKLRLVKSLTDKGEYKHALDALSKNTTDHEVLNCRGVCLLRMREFAQAINPLRMVALNSSTFQVREAIPSHIKINFALALFFGGEPAGAMETLSQIKPPEDDPCVMMIRSYAKQWVKQMSLLRRVDWYLNRIAPKQGPSLPDEPVGRFIWDLEQPPC